MRRLFEDGYSRIALALCALMVGFLSFAAPMLSAQASTLPDYQLVETFSLPGSGGPFDVLDDGRIIALGGTTVYVESAPGSRSFSSIGVLAGADFSSFGAAFVRMSKAGDKIAVGNGGGASFSNFQVGVFQLSNLAGTWFTANHFDAEWITNRLLALTAGAFGSPSIVTALDTNSSNPAAPVNRTLINNIGGASGGVTFDILGNLYTGNGFASTGPSDTGDIKAFSALQWIGPLFGAPAVNFETSGTPIVDLLSASSLGFDARGNLLVGGGDFFGGTDLDFAAVVNGSDVLQALLGGGPVNPADPNEVLKLDPDGSSSSNLYTIQANHPRDELYVVDSSSPTVFVYQP